MSYSRKNSTKSTKMQVYKPKNRAALTNHIRLKVYGYIDTKMCLTHLTRLSKSEKERLMNSYFVRKGRYHTL